MASFKMMIPVAYIIVVLLAGDVAEAAIGMNWGRETAQRLVPSQVVDLLLQNGIRQARIYTSDVDILRAFVESGINLTVGVFNAAAFTTIDSVRTWLQEKGPYFTPANVRTIYLGGYPYPFIYGIENKAFLHNAINSLQTLQNALNDDGYGEIKVTFRQYRGILKNVTRPSDAEFVDEIKEEMITTLRFLQENNAPFVIEMFPIISTMYYSNFDPSFAFPDNKSTQVVRDINGAVYTNMFEFEYDSYVWALNKLNASNIKIIVGQIGWPTDGFPGANASNAARFYKGLLPLVASNKGTPMRPGLPIDIYLHSLTDENKIPYQYPFARHWGIYRSNGEPKYGIDLSGQGRDIFPTTVKGIMRMPERWCMFNEDLKDLNKVMTQFNKACADADCTCLAPGGSCSQLSFEQNISYAFNMYFQFQFQDEKACTFEGLSYVSVDNPSTDECVFPVEVIKGQQLNFKPLVDVGKGLHESPNFAIFLFLLSILATLIWN